MSNRLVCLSLILLFLGSCAPHARLPVWADKQPYDPLYYSSVVRISKQYPNYKELAFENALKNISMQISVNVDASVYTRETESFGLSNTDFSSSIQTSSRTQLSDVELFESHETKQQYLAWYRLNKQSFLEKRRLQALNATNLALELLTQYDQLLGKESLDFGQASGLVIKALDLLSEYPDFDLSAQYQGKTINLYSQLLQRLSSLAAGTSVWLSPSSLNAIARRKADLLAYLTCSFEDSISLASVPLKLQFTRGEGELIPCLITDAKGEAKLVVKRVLSYERQQSVLVAIDKAALTEKSEHPIVKKLISGLSFKNATLSLEVRRPRIAVQYSYNEMGSSNIRLLANRLRELELEVVDTASDADYLLEVSIRSEAGPYVELINQHSAFAHANLSLIDLALGITITSETLRDVKATGARSDLAQRKSETACINAINEELMYRMVYLNVVGF